MTKGFREGTNKLPGQDAAFADTEPMAMPELQPATSLDMPGGLSLAPVETSLYEVMAAIRKDNRVCPQPTRWLEFYRILQDGSAGARCRRRR